MLEAARQQRIDAVPIDRKMIPWASVERLAEYIRSLNADTLVHCAANTNVERCELDPNSAYRDNTFLTEMIASACRTLGVKLIYISSTGVYGDHKIDSYTEFDEVLPTTVHHKSKLLAEYATVAHCPGALIIRTGWLFGGSPNNPKNFVVNRIREARACEGELISNKDQYGVPTFVGDVATRVFELQQDGFCGTYNCVNTGKASRYEYVCEIVRAASLNVPVAPKGAEIFKRVAPVSNNETAVNSKMNMIGMPPMREWREALHSYVSELMSV